MNDSKDAPPGAYAALETPTTKNRLDQGFDHVEDVDSGAATSKQDIAADGKLASFRQLFAFADGTDTVLMAGGAVAALAAGISQPIQLVLVGDVLNAFNPKAGGAMRDDINRVALHFALVGVAVVVACFLQVALWSITAARQAKRIRSAYVSAILTKEIGWFDVNEPMQLATKVADSAVIIQQGIGRKIGDGLYFFSMTVSGIVIGLVKGWQLTLVLLAFMPLLAFTANLSMKVLASATQNMAESYGKAGAVAQEALSNVRTVHMFNSIQHFVRKYEQALHISTKSGIKKAFAVGWGTGIMFFVVFCTYAVGMYFGATKVANDVLGEHKCTGAGCYDGGRVITVFFSVIMGAMALGQAGPSIQAITSARATAYSVFEVINRASRIDPLDDTGDKLAQVAGRIEISNVSFAYPSRPHVKVCSNYSLTIEPGETVALVGPSGSGKSTIVSLLERFYDPQEGVVKLDGHNVKDLNVKWLRQQLGLVGQEPSLFATSIMENIRYGCPSASDDDVRQAAKMANAYKFIMEFPQGFDTEVGERGTQLSGGQKQRIAIARAIIKNPSVLLLDEATSALDTESERVVQESLDRLLATSTRTTIIIAHRLSTIRNANRIAVHSRGSIVEIGTHDELMQLPNGQYRLLVEAQFRKAERDDEDRAEEQNASEYGLSLHRQDSLRQSHRSVDSTGKDGAVDVADECSDAEIANVSVSRVWQMSLPEWKFLLFGACGAVVNAATFPVWGVLLTKITVLFFDRTKTPSEMRATAGWWSLGFFGLGVVFGTSIIVQHYGFGVTSQRLIARVRLQTFTAMLRQEIGWFDMDENTSGALIARLATDSATLQAMTSDMLNQGLVNVTTLGIGLIISFCYCWQMALVATATLPLFVSASYFEAQVMNGMNNKTNNDADTAAGSLLGEAVGSIRTVASFSMEKVLASAYESFVGTSKTSDVKAGLSAGLAFGYSQGFMFWNMALMFYLSGRWVTNGTATFEHTFMVQMVIMVSSFGVGLASANMSDAYKGKKAAANIFKIIDRTPAIEVDSTKGEVLAHVHGDIEFRGVAFTYPARPDTQIYKNYNLKINSGQTVALVGASGSGKSTAISLMERFYDPLAGVVTLDGTDFKSLSLVWLREHISLVSQEPVLFAGTIAENIAMGKPGSSREEVIGAAKKANAHDFICNFPDGYDTDVGDRGAQVSGGQKQRIEIARAILRDPEVLLLDEATSALDNESERVVQESLDRLMKLKRRTTIVVAHRLSTIRNADLIAVTKDGEIVEQGTHDQLMQIEGGVYKSLVAKQHGH